jgi:hypothetical protein
MYVKFVAWYVGASFVIMEILWFVWCRPFHFYWKVPAPNRKYTTSSWRYRVLLTQGDSELLGRNEPHDHERYFQSVFGCNDYRTSNARPHRFTVALETEAHALLCFRARHFYNIGGHSEQVLLFGHAVRHPVDLLVSTLSPYPINSADFMPRYIREVSTAIIAANLPLTWTLLQRIFGMSNFHSRNKSSDPRSGRVTGTNKFRSTYGNLTSRTRDTHDRKPKDPHPIDISPSESQEQINGENDYPLKIWQQQEVQITSEELDPNDRASLSDKSDKSVRPTVTSGGDPQVRNVDMGIVTKVTHTM